MLNQAERFHVLKNIRYWCKLGSLPAKVDLSTWEVLPPAKRWTTWLCHFSIFLFGLHALYKLVALAYWLRVGFPLHQAVFHTMLTVIVPVYIYWYYALYIKYPRLFGGYFKMTLTGNTDETAVESLNLRAWFRRLKEYTLQDVFVMSLSYTFPVAGLAIMLTFISNPSMKYLLYAALPKEHQTWITFGILLLEEWRYLVGICSIAIPIWTVQVISFDIVRNKLQLLINSMQRSGNIYKSLQLYVSIINLINCNIIFSCKILFIGLAIGTGYAAIAHFGSHPVFGVMYYLIFVNSSCIYIFCYGNAFKIPDLFQTVTQRAVLVKRGENSEASKIFKRQMRSFPRMGIKVGEFNLMERESTMNFIDFVFNNIVSLLVAYA